MRSQRNDTGCGAVPPRLREGKDCELAVYFESEIDTKKEAILKAVVARIKAYPSEYSQMSGIEAHVSNEQAQKVKHADGNSQALKDMGADVKVLLDETFDPWKEMAKPEYWETAKSNLKKATENLIDGGLDSYEEGQITSGEVTNAKAPIPELAGRTRDSISGWWGETSNSFKRNYANQFGYIIGMQANVGKALHKAAMAEYEAYKSAQKELLNLMDDFADAVSNLGSMSGDDKDFAIGVGVAAAGVISAMGPPVGVVVALTAASGGANVINDYVKKYGGGDTSATIAGDTLPEVWSNVKGHLHTIRVEIQDTETTLYKALSEIESALAGRVEVEGEAVPAMNLLMPPAPAFVQQVEKAATGGNSDKELDKLKDQSSDEGDQVEAPGGEYAPEPIDT